MRLLRLCDEQDREWRAAIRQAIKAGCKVTEVADIAEITGARSYQIKKGRR